MRQERPGAVVAERPGSVVAAIWSLGALIAVSGLSAVLTVVFEQDLIDSLVAPTCPTPARSSRRPSCPVAIVMFVVVAMLAFVLVAFFRAGFGWARVVLTAMVLLLAVGSVVIMQAGPPALFWILSAVSLVLEIVVVACLWHRDTGAFLAAGPEADLPALIHLLTRCRWCGVP